jgi:hypothetical protein
MVNVVQFERQAFTQSEPATAIDLHWPGDSWLYQKPAPLFIGVEANQALLLWTRAYQAHFPAQDIDKLG